jgi:hypothetical protein
MNHRGLLAHIKQTGLRVIHEMQGKLFLHFLHIGKTGGTAVKHALTQHSIDSRYAIYLHRHEFRLRDVPMGEQVFFFLRNPISRFISGFYSRQRQGQPRYFSAWKENEKSSFEEFTTPNQLALALSSNDVEKKNRARLAMKTIRHVRDSYWKWFDCEEYFRSRLSDVFFVGRQERLAEDFEILKARLGLPEHLKLPGDDVNAHRTYPQVNKDLDEEAVANLRDWYQDDFRFVALCEDLVETQVRESPVDPPP